ncbi:MAG: helix-turn-helix domain-containing protein [Peptococcaceae bacterium]|jgi:TrpR-related protein YerC/YecD|nr:helix-turn-helix domain-containing protein [Peptococcaceae bacterium]MBQ5703329.1 helix-turn-helix domain-containing protein [Peptococcaceae bacterium]MBQ5858635.1 helix-turn-helix domain-containing protein [Peptococcaceae bacterium]
MYQSKLKDEQIDGLFDAMQQLQTKEEFYRFFEDISTVSEIKALAQRMEVARMLDEEKTYTEIASKTGASTATISRVKRCLNYGADGYRLVLERLKENK